MARDVTGAPRANLFEVLTATDGTRYVPVNGTGARVRYNGSDGTSIDMDSRRYTGDDLQQRIKLRAEYPAVYGTSL